MGLPVDAGRSTCSAPSPRLLREWSCGSFAIDPSAAAGDPARCRLQCDAASVGGAVPDVQLGADLRACLLAAPAGSMAGVNVVAVSRAAAVSGVPPSTVDWGFTLGANAVALRLRGTVTRAPLSYYGALVHCTHCADVDLGVEATSLYGAVASDAALAAAGAAAGAARDVGTGAVHLGAAASLDAAYLRCSNITGAAGWACLAVSYNPAQGLTAVVREVQASATTTHWPAAATACTDLAAGGGGLLVGGGAVLVRPGSAYLAAGGDTCSAGATAAVSVTFTGATPGLVSSNTGGCGPFLSVLGCGSMPVQVSATALTATKNAAALYGGAVFLHQQAGSSAPASLTLSGVALTENTAKFGGAVASDVGTNTVLVQKNGATPSLIKNNTALQAGGAFHMAGALTSFTVTDGASVVYNKATAGDGGALCVGGHITQLRLAGGSQLSGNAAGRNGGAVFASGTSLAALPAATRADVSSRLAAVLPAEWANMTGIVAFAEAAVNASSLSLAALVLEGGSEVSGNVALAGQGGAIAGGGHILTLPLLGSSAGGGVMAGNSAATRGGAVATDGLIGDVTVSATAAVSGNAVGAGGLGAALYAGLGLLGLTINAGASITGFSAAQGGFAYAGQVVGAVTIADGSSVTANTATTGEGGFLYAGYGVARVLVTTGSSVSANAAATSGGAVFSGGVIGSLEFADDSQLHYNTAGAGYPGAAVYAAGVLLADCPALAAQVAALLGSAVSPAQRSDAAVAAVLEAVRAGKAGIGRVSVRGRSSIHHQVAATGAGGGGTGAIGGAVGSGGHVMGVVVSDSIVYGCAAYSGGLVGSDGIIANVDIRNGSRLYGNSATMYGGVMYGGLGIINARLSGGSKVDGNQADAGGVLAGRGIIAGVAAERATFESNLAISLGGVAYAAVLISDWAMSDGSAALKNSAVTAPGETMGMARFYKLELQEDSHHQLCLFVRRMNASAVPAECTGGMRYPDDYDRGPRPAENVSFALAPVMPGLLMQLALVTNGPVWTGINITGSGGGLFSWGNIDNFVATGNTRIESNHAERYGGFIAAVGKIRGLQVSNGSSVIKNTALWTGGMVFAYGNITDLVFKDNTTMKSNVAYMGGIVSTLTGMRRFRAINNSTFRENYSNASGSVLYLGDWATLNNTMGDLDDVLVANNSGFYGNMAFWTGGVIYTGKSLTNVLIQNNCGFEKNNATSEGGVFVVLGNIDNFVCERGCRMSGNYAKHAGVFGAHGNVWNFTLQHDSLIEDNISDLDGGVFSILAGGDMRNLTVRGNSHVRGNLALGDGGAIAVWRIWPLGYTPQPGIDGITVADGSSFALNHAFKSGGAISATGPISNVVISNGSYFQGNLAKSGGAFSSNSSVTSVLVTGRSSLFNNSAGDGGGGVLSCNGDLRDFVVADGSALESNRAAFFGGALRVGGSVTGLNFTGGSRAVANAVTGRGGLLWCGGNASSIAIAASNVSRNSATDEGGGLFVSGQLAGVSVSGVARVEDNAAGKLGGAFYAVEGVAGFSAATQSTLSRNRASSGGLLASNGSIVSLSVTGAADVSENVAFLDAGGAVYSAKDIRGVQFADGSAAWRNDAREKGGFMYAAGNITRFEVSASVFAFNRAGLLGGVAAAGGVLDHVSLAAGSEMRDNRVSGLGGMGGALQAAAIVDVAVSGGSGMWANAATDNGGAIHSAASIRGLSISQQSRLDNNTAGGLGGAVFAGEDVSSLFLLESASMSGNIARDHGGAVACSGRLANMQLQDGSQLSFNTAGKKGGALYASNVELTASRGAALVGNTATWGGALYVQRALDWLVLDAGSRLAGSRAVDSGGAVYIVGDGAAASTSITAAAATATAASGPPAGPSSVVVRGGSTIENNVAAAAGGFLFAFQGNISSLEVDDRSSIANCSAAGGSGGAVYSGGAIASVRISNGSSVKYNSATQMGGAFFSALGLDEVLVLGGSSLSANEVALDGGAVATLGAIRQVVVAGGSALDDNRALGGRGGAVYTPYALANLSVSGGSSASHNYAARAGGLLHCLPGLAALEVTAGSTLDGNLAAAGDGGCVVAQVVARLRVTDSALQNNRAAAGFGGCVSSRNSTSVVNSVTGSDGNITNVTPLDWLVAGSRLSNNTATEEGGAFFMNAAQTSAAASSLQLIGTEVLGNSAQNGRGGAFAVVGNCHVDITYCTMANNTAATSGGAVAMWDPAVAMAASRRRRLHSRSLLMQLTTGNGTTATQALADAYPADAAAASAFNASGSAFSFSRAETGDGSAVWVYGAAHAMLTGCSLDHGRARGDGGAVALVGVAAVALVNTSISACRAVVGHGGGLSVIGSDQILIAGSTISSNAAVQAGGVYIAPPSPLLAYSSAPAILIYDTRMNDNTAGKLTAEQPAAAYPGFAGGLFIGHHNASVLVAQSDFGGNCGWLGAAVVALVDRSTNTSDLRGVDSAGLVSWLVAGEANATRASVDVSSTGAGADSGSAADNSTMLQRLGNLTTALQGFVVSAAGDTADAALVERPSSFVFMQRTALVDAAADNNCSSYHTDTEADLVRAERQPSAVWVDDIDTHGVFSDDACGFRAGVCLTTSISAGMTWLEGPAAAGTMRINGQVESVVRSGHRFSLTVILRDEYGLPVSTILEGGEYNGTISLLRLDLPSARALLRDTPQLLPALAAPRDRTVTLACLPDDTVVEAAPDPLNTTYVTPAASACAADKAVAYLAATGEQGLSVSFAERGTLQWADLMVRGWPGGNYTLAITVTGPSLVSPVFLPIFLDGCDTGEFLDTSRAPAAASSATSTSGGSSGSSGGGSLSGVLAVLETASCVPCPRRQLSQQADPRPLLGADDSYPAALPELQSGISAAKAVCEPCPDHAVCPGGRVVVPEPGYWHSSPTSLYMIRCPNADACMGNGVVDVSNSTDGGSTDPTAATDNSITAAMAETLDSIGSADTRTLRLAACQQTWYTGSIDKLLAGTNRLTLPPTNLSTWPCVLTTTGVLSADGAAAAAASPQLYTEQQCAEGHTGNLCAACQPGYVSSPDFTCEQCPENATTHTAGIAILMLCVHVYFIMWLSIQHFREIAPRDSDKEDDGDGDGDGEDGGADSQEAAGGGGGEPASLGEVIKLGVLHYQQLLIIWRLNINYPPIITRYVGAMGAATTSLTSFFAYQPACLLPDLDSSGQSRLAFLYAVISPFIAMVCSLVLWSLCYATFRKYFWWWSVNHSSRPRQAPPPQQPGGSKKGSVTWGKLNRAFIMDSGDVHPAEALEGQKGGVTGDTSRPGTAGRSGSGSGMQHRKKGQHADTDGVSGSASPYKPPSSDDEMAAPASVAGRTDYVALWLKQLFVCCLVAVFYLYPAWADVGLSTFACFVLDASYGPITPDQKAGYLFGYWIGNMNQECYSGEHAAFFVPIGIAIVVVCCILPPLFTLFSLARTSLEQRQYDGETRLMYGFLFKPYKNSLYWYDSMMQLQVFGLVAVSVFGRVMLVEYQALMLLAVLLAFASINVLARPLKSDVLNNLQFFSSAVLCSTIALSLYFVLGEYLPIAQGGEATIALIIIAMNCVVVIIFLSLKAHEIRQQVAAAWAWLAHGGCRTSCTTCWAAAARRTGRWRRGPRQAAPRDAPLEINDPEDGMRIPLDADPNARLPSDVRSAGRSSAGRGAAKVGGESCMDVAWWKSCFQPPAEDLPPAAAAAAVAPGAANAAGGVGAAAKGHAAAPTAATSLVPISTSIAVVTARVMSDMGSSQAPGSSASPRSSAKLDPTDPLVQGSVLASASASASGSTSVSTHEITSTEAGSAACGSTACGTGSAARSHAASPVMRTTTASSNSRSSSSARRPGSAQAAGLVTAASSATDGRLSDGGDKAAAPTAVDAPLAPLPTPLPAAGDEAEARPLSPVERRRTGSSGGAPDVDEPVAAPAPPAQVVGGGAAAAQE
ncbi:hypothetical protein HXX76_013044 [Chlamydomonas incerta]|uniref:Uncharacterized protein n=1 Tax=Chlamydomonas incerta TaxID=51695 RepID=A0A835SJU9_CHLIN|nr:hypothetical protein HXX76_013044 [Chlamydomonas incerta]|eukprot:KAG2426287.1 hypothetical protein HXX76_013044 [Chlamydomonas incerta]